MAFENVYSSFRRFANRAADKINQTADIATLQVKISMAEKKLEDAFTFLGKAAYEHFSSENDNSDKVAAAMSNIENIKKEIAALEAQLADAKKKAQAQDEAWKQEAAARAEAAQKAQEEAQTEAEADAEAPTQEDIAETDGGQAEEANAKETPTAEKSTILSADSTASDAVEIEIETEP